MDRGRARLRTRGTAGRLRGSAAPSRPGSVVRVGIQKVLPLLTVQRRLPRGCARANA